MSMHRTDLITRGLRRIGATRRPRVDAAPAAIDGPSAPELSGVLPWLNTADDRPLTLASLAGGVVLLEFWTFACGNCVRTLPFLKAMHVRHHGAGLTVVGVHTPELPHERPPRNVARFVRDNGLSFPVGIDNDFAAWRAYDNRYWPTQYLIDRTGAIRHKHEGEGSYRRTEAMIVALLAESGD